MGGAGRGDGRLLSLLLLLLQQEEEESPLINLPWLRRTRVRGASGCAAS